MGKKSKARGGGKDAAAASAAAADASASASSKNAAARKLEAKKAAARAAAGCFTHDLELVRDLALLGMRIREALADGNCLFRALSISLADALVGCGGEAGAGERAHNDLRARCCDYILQHPDDFAPFVTGEDAPDKTLEAYVARMRRPSVWGGNAELIAAARMLGRPIYVYQRGQPRWRVACTVEEEKPPAAKDGEKEEEEEGGKGKGATTAERQRAALAERERAAREAEEEARALHVSYHGGDHYNAVVRVGGGGGGAPAVAAAPTPAKQRPPSGGEQEKKPKEGEGQDAAAAAAATAAKGALKPPSRNKACPCGSMQKFKACCGAATKAVAAAGGAAAAADSLAALAVKTLAI
jgi:hypothetical protein